jgi:hypothetical protein
MVVLARGLVAMIKPTLDDYSRQEALHMTAFLMKAVIYELSEHPAVEANPQWLALAERAAEALHDLYQAIGAEQHL